MNRAPRRNGKRGLDDGSINPQKRWLAVAFEHSKASCFKLLDALRSNREAGPFNIPVDPVALGCPDYLQKIKHPMDFGTVAFNLQNNKYKDSREFCRDMRLVFSNCHTYNQEGSQIYQMAANLQTIFEDSWINIELLESKTLHEAELQDMRQQIEKLKSEHELLHQELKKLQNGETPVTRTASASNLNTTTNGEPAKKKPKKKKTNISMKQKEQLGRKIEKLSLPSIEKLIAQFPLYAAVKSGELEIDLNLNMTAFKQLNSFVDKCYKEQAANGGIAQDPNSTSSLEAKEDSSSDSDSDSSSESSDSSDSEQEKESLAVKAQE